MTEQRDTSHKDRKLSELYRLADKAEPSARLDTLIKSAAHDAVKKAPSEKAGQPKPASYQHRQSWFALAAVIALVAIALPIMLDESDQILFEPDLLQQQQSSGKLTEMEAGDRPSLADAVVATPSITPATVSAPKITPAPAMELQKTRPEKKARRKRPDTMPAERTITTKQAIKEERQETRSFMSKQKAYSDQKAPAISGIVAMPLDESTSRADVEPHPAALWQDQIRQLLQEKQLDKARTELLSLQKVWPDFHVDPDLLRQTGLLTDPPPAPGSEGLPH